jgi:ribosomal protein L40E
LDSQREKIKELNMETIQIKCRECGKVVQLRVNKHDYDEWCNRFGSENPRHIQDIFPYLTAGEREMFLTQICDDCYTKIFGFEEDEDEQ